MIEVFCGSSPNCYKILILLEDLGVDYRLVPIDLDNDPKTVSGFLEASPDGKIPAILDHGAGSEGGSRSLFESGAILLYLAEKSGRFIADNLTGRSAVLQWLFWQVSNFGPVLGQLMYFRRSVNPDQPALRHFPAQAHRLYRFLDRELQHRTHLAGTYSIANMAIYPWAALHENQGFNLPDYQNLLDWYCKMEAREAMQRVYDVEMQ